MYVFYLKQTSFPQKACNDSDFTWTGTSGKAPSVLKDTTYGITWLGCRLIKVLNWPAGSHLFPNICVTEQKMSQEEIYGLMLKEEGIPHSAKHGSDPTFFYVLLPSNLVNFKSNFCPLH